MCSDDCEAGPNGLAFFTRHLAKLALELTNSPLDEKYNFL